MAFTPHDTPAIKARIQADLDHTVHVLRRDDPWLKSLVLTGSFARGEGAVRDGIPQNDYDFVALRGIAPPNRPYEQMRADLEEATGMHVDLAPVSSWRLRWVARSIFWYETAASGQVVWGDDLLRRIPIRDARDIDPEEGLRLLVNRAAGLLLSIGQDDESRRLQAAKALLGGLDAHMLALQRFAPSHTQRWGRYLDLRAEGAPAMLESRHEWLAWALRYKTDPAGASGRDASAAWREAARLVHQSVPVALAHAGLRSLEEYATHDHVVDRLHYARHASGVPGAARGAPHPTGQVRLATLRLLEASLDGTLAAQDAHDILDDVAGHRDSAAVPGGPLQVLESLRAATLQ